MSQFNQDIYITVYDELGKPIEIRFVTDSEPHQRLKNYGDCDFYLHLKTNEEKLNANIFNLIEDAVMVMKKNQKAFPANSERPFKQLITLNPDRDERLYFRRAEGRENIPLGTIIMVLDRILDYFQEELHLLDEEDQKAMEKSNSMWDEEFDDHQDEPKEKNISTVKFDEVEHSEYGAIDGERYEGQTTHSAWDWDDEHTDEDELNQWKSEQFKSSEPDDVDVWRQTEIKSDDHENDFAQWNFDDNTEDDRAQHAQEEHQGFNSFDDERSDFPSNEESNMWGDSRDEENYDNNDQGTKTFDDVDNNGEHERVDEDNLAESNQYQLDNSFYSNDDFPEQAETPLSAQDGQDLGFPDVVSSERLEIGQKQDDFTSQFTEEKINENHLNEHLAVQESEEEGESSLVEDELIPHQGANEQKSNKEDAMAHNKKDDNLKHKTNELLPEENGDDDDDDDFLKELGA